MLVNQLNTETVYEYHLKVAIAKMSNCLSSGKLECVHKVLCNTPGYFVLDTPRCIEYIIINLNKLGFAVEYLGSCVLHIAWESSAAKSEPVKVTPKLSSTQADALKKIKRQLKVRFKLPAEEY